MKEFFKPRKLNIIDLILLLLVAVSFLLFFFKTPMKNEVNKVKHDIKNISEVSKSYNLNNLEAKIKIIELIQQGYKLNLERIEQLEINAVETAGIILKINDWTRDTDIQINGIFEYLQGQISRY